jgi:hypothetical protein
MGKGVMSQEKTAMVHSLRNPLLAGHSVLEALFSPRLRKS